MYRNNTFKRITESKQLSPDQLVKDAEQIMIRAYAYSRLHSKLTAAALKKYGDHGSNISGVVRDHFPEGLKNILRFTAHRVGQLLGDSRESWRQARKRHHTWIRLKNETIDRYGKGFYG